MASITILFRRSVPVLHRSPCSRSRCVSLGFLPLPCVRLSPLRSPHPCSKISPISECLPFLRVPLQYGFLVRFMFSPRRVRFRFPQLSPLLLSLPCVRSSHIGSTAAYSPTGDSAVPRTLFRVRFYRSDLADQLLWPAGLPKRAHTTPPERQSQQGKRRQINLSFSNTFTVEIGVCKC